LEFSSDDEETQAQRFAEAEKKAQQKEAERKEKEARQEYKRKQKEIKTQQKEARRQRKEIERANRVAERQVAEQQRREEWAKDPIYRVVKTVTKEARYKEEHGVCLGNFHSTEFAS